MNNIPFGFRIYVVAVISFLISDVVYHMVCPYEMSDVRELPSTFYYVVFLVYMIVLNIILRARANRAVYGISLLVTVYVAVIMIVSFYGLPSHLAETKDLHGFSYLQFILLGIVLPCAIAILPPTAMYWGHWFKEHPMYRLYLQGLGGASKWGGIMSFHKYPAKLKQGVFSTYKEGVTSTNILMGRTLFRHDPMPRLIGINDEVHAVTVAPSRSGKSVNTISILSATYPGDMVFLDVKGEHTENTFHRRCSKNYLKEKGIPIPKGVKHHLKNGEGIVLDPCNKTSVPSSSYNPLSEINIGADDCREIISAIADGCILSENVKHFEEIPKKILKGLIVYVLWRFPNDVEKCSLPYILDLLTGIDKDGFADASPAKFRELLMEMQVCSSAGGMSQDAAALLLKMSEKEKGSHLGVLSRGLEWCGDPAMRKHLIDSDFKFSEVGTKINAKGERITQSIYVVLPDTRMGDLKRWMRVLLAVSTVAMRKRKHHPKHRTLFVLDEFPLLGHIKTIEDGFGLLPGYHIKFWIFCQSLGQIKSSYPTYWNAMIAQSTCQFFGQPPTDIETLEFISKGLGQHNLNMRDLLVRNEGKGNTPRALLTPTEIAILIGKGTNKQIVFPSGGFPLFLERLSFKPIRIYGKRFSALPLGGLQGHFPKHQKH